MCMLRSCVDGFKEAVVIMKQVSTKRDSLSAVQKEGSEGAKVVDSREMNEKTVVVINCTYVIKNVCVLSSNQIQMSILKYNK